MSRYSRTVGRPKESHGDDVASHETGIGRPTLEMIMDAYRRNAAPRSITAWVMGDPAPGQSALDKRDAPSSSQVVEAINLAARKIAELKAIDLT